MVLRIICKDVLVGNWAKKFNLRKINGGKFANMQKCLQLQHNQIIVVPISAIKQVDSMNCTHASIPESKI